MRQPITCHFALLWMMVAVALSYASFVTVVCPTALIVKFEFALCCECTRQDFFSPQPY
eukprot:m.465223 g.465223  ORF g.465223 m.465223 type:complete len:58 (-) comp24039_c0_seq1:43-216(-)